jgi:lambda family phage minor tail protein L
MTTVAFETEIQKLAASALIELFEVDLTNFGDTKYYFHAGTNALQTNVVWQGNTYVAWPAQASGFEYKGNGQLPRPKLILANVSGAITALILAYEDCVGAKVTRRLTMAKFLDAVNFTGGTNPDADPAACYPDEIYFIDRKAAEDQNTVEFELTAAFDVTGVKLPRRQIIQNLCTWRYRGSECSYAGPPVASRDDVRFILAQATTAQEIAYVNAYNSLKTSYDTLVAARADVAAKLKILNDTIASGTLSLAETRFNTTNYVQEILRTGPLGTVIGTTTSGLWDGVSVSVTVDGVYRKGTYQNNFANNVERFQIQRWAVDVTTPQTNYNNSVTALNTAQTNYNTALTTYNSAVSALPTNSPLYSLDVCGKRLSSCKMRFADFFQTGELPFGGFPGAGLT